MKIESGFGDSRDAGDLNPDHACICQLVPPAHVLDAPALSLNDTEGMHNVQMRFHPLSTTLIGSDCTRTPR